jgi:hypothetical protein
VVYSFTCCYVGVCTDPVLVSALAAAARGEVAGGRARAPLGEPLAELSDASDLRLLIAQRSLAHRAERAQGPRRPLALHLFHTVLGARPPMQSSLILITF